MEPKRLYRNTSDKVIAGVCSGLGEYFVMDPLLIRLIFIVLALAAGGGVLTYIVLWIAMPVKTQVPNSQEKQSNMENPTYPQEEPVRPSEGPGMSAPVVKKRRQRGKGNLIGGLVLITLGFLFLADEFIPNVNFGDLWPVLLVVIGIGLLITGISGKKHHPNN